MENELQAELTSNADVFAEDTAKRFAESLQVTFAQGIQNVCRAVCLKYECAACGVCQKSIIRYQLVRYSDLPVVASSETLWRAWVGWPT